jgi:hypothetical protein
MDLRDASWQVFTTSASIASPSHIRWQHAGCSSVVYATRVIDTLRVTASSCGSWTRDARALQTLRVAGQNDLLILPMMTVDSDDGGAMVDRQGPPRKHWATPLQLLEPGLDANVGNGDATVGWQGMHRQHQVTPLTLLEHRLGTASEPLRRALSSFTC